MRAGLGDGDFATHLLLGLSELDLVDLDATEPLAGVRERDAGHGRASCGIAAGESVDLNLDHAGAYRAAARTARVRVPKNLFGRALHAEQPGIGGHAYPSENDRILFGFSEMVYRQQEKQRILEQFPLLSYFPAPENDDYWKMTSSAPSISTAAFPDLLSQLGPIFGNQLAIDVSECPRDPSGRAGPAFAVNVVWGNERFEFAAEANARNTPRALEQAIGQSRRWALASGRLPMVIVPFLAEKRIEQLAEEGVSGLDLCGNGLLIAAGRLLIQRTGQPNRYPESRPARFAYRGATSLVPRVFLRRARFDSVGQIREEIEAAGGNVVLSTVSKALARMADDFIIDRSANRIEVIQPDKLLDALLEDFMAPKAERVVQLKTPLVLDEIFRRVSSETDSTLRPRMVLSGASSQDRYAAGLRADAPVVYTQDLGEMRKRLGDAWVAVDRFANLTVIETRDPTAYFDARASENGVTFASPVQSYLELASGGDKRDFELAQQIRVGVLEALAKDHA